MLQCSRQSINELVKRGVIPQDADGLIDVEMARLAIANRVRPSAKSAALVQNGPQPPEPPAGQAITPASDDQAVTSYHVAKTLREAAEARIAQLKLAELQGQLVRADEWAAALARRAAAFREGLLQIPARLSAQLAAETDETRIHALLDAELRQVMLQLTDAA
jgi:hypothetical protein